MPLVVAFMNSITADVWRGGEKWMVNAASGLAERGHSVICIGRTGAVWLHKARERGLETRELPIHGDFDPFIIAKLVRLFRQKRIDVLCCNFEKDVRLGGIAGRIAKVRHIFVRKGLTLMYNRLRYRLAYKYIVDDIITPAAFIKKQLSAFPWLAQDRIHVIYNGVTQPDTASWNKNRLRKAADIPAGEPVALGAGSVFSQKGFEYLVEAAAIVRRNGIALHVAIAGSGEDEGLIRDLATRLGISTYVHLLGHRSDVPELMFGADIFVLSSIDEGLPNVVLEAMSVGTPVVAADAGGTGEIITNGQDGFIVPIKNAGAIAEKLLVLLRDSDKRTEIGNHGLATIKSRFSIPAMITAIDRLFVSRTA